MDKITGEVAPASVSVSQTSEISSLTFTPQPNSSLLGKLPGELRNEIIRLAVVRDEEIPIKFGYYTNRTTEESRPYLRIGHPLMLACKQLRQESAEIYFLENTFCLTDEFFGASVRSDDDEPHDEDKEDAIAALIRILGPWAAQVQKLGVSHTMEGPLGPTHVRFSMSLEKEEPGSALENATSCDPSSLPFCCCHIFQLANLHPDIGVLEFAQRYVHMMGVVERNNAPVHCWSCGLRSVL